MNNFEKEKLKYESIEIPQELGEKVAEAIGENSPKRSYQQHSFKRMIPVAAAAVLLLSVGMTQFYNYKNPGETDSDNTPVLAETTAEATPAAGNTLEDCALDKGASEEAQKNSAMRNVGYHNLYVQNKFDESIEECISRENNESAYGEISEIYSDEEVLSYSVTTFPSNNVNFYNIVQSDGTDISIESLLGDNSEFNSDNCEFYIKAKNKLVVIQNGEETEIIYN